MAIDITMPALSPTMTEGTLARWMKKPGEAVRAGDVLLEIETDKATMEVEAVDEGKIGKILVDDGTEGVKVGTVIAVLLEEGEAEVPARKAASKANKAPAAKARPQPDETPESAKKPAPKPAEAAAPAAAEFAKSGSGVRIFVSPLARRLAAEKGVDLSAVQGSGPHGRIVKADIEQAKPGKASPGTTAAPVSGGPSLISISKDQVQALAGGIGYDLVPHNNMRRAIAKRLTESKQTVPHFYLTVDCEIDQLLKGRAELNAAADTKISVNDFVIRAAALALRKVPAANASWSQDGTLLWQSIDIAVAVALDDGLITPIVKNADQKGLGTISGEVKELAQRAKMGKLKLEEFQGGTFSISNLGMYGIREFSAVINPPHGCILAVGAGEQRAVVKDGALAVATVMSCTLSVDHRVVDGAVGAQFLSAFKRFVESPLSMLL